jgi:hypothetical protein
VSSPLLRYTSVDTSCSFLKFTKEKPNGWKSSIDGSIQSWKRCTRTGWKAGSAISDHVKPKLVIKLDTPAPADETWWIRLVGLYNGKTYTDRFAQGKTKLRSPIQTPAVIL